MFRVPLTIVCNQDGGIITNELRYYIFLARVTKTLTNLRFKLKYNKLDVRVIDQNAVHLS